MSRYSRAFRTGTRLTVTLVIILALSTTLTSAAEINMKAEPETGTVKTGQTFNVTVHLTQPEREPEVYGGTFTLTFDDDKLKPLTVTQGTYLKKNNGDARVIVNNTGNGSVEYAETLFKEDRGVIGGGELATVRLRAEKPGTVELALEGEVLVKKPGLPPGKSEITTTGTTVEVEPTPRPNVGSGKAEAGGDTPWILVAIILASAAVTMGYVLLRRR